MAILQTLRRTKVNPQTREDPVVVILTHRAVRKHRQARNGPETRLKFKAQTTQTRAVLVVFPAKLQRQIRRRVPLEVGPAIDTIGRVLAKLRPGLTAQREPLKINLPRAAEPEHVRVAPPTLVRVPANPGTRQPQQTPARITPEQIEPRAADNIAVTKPVQTIKLNPVRMAKRHGPRTRQTPQTVLTCTIPLAHPAERRQLAVRRRHRRARTGQRFLRRQHRRGGRDLFYSLRAGYGLIRRSRGRGGRALSFSPRTRRRLTRRPHRRGRRDLFFSLRTRRRLTRRSRGRGGRALSFNPRTRRRLTRRPHGRGRRDLFLSPRARRRLLRRPHRRGRRDLFFSPRTRRRLTRRTGWRGRRALSFNPRTRRRLTRRPHGRGRRDLFLSPRAGRRLLRRPHWRGGRDLFYSLGTGRGLPRRAGGRADIFAAFIVFPERRRRAHRRGWRAAIFAIVVFFPESLRRPCGRGQRERQQTGQGKRQERNAAQGHCLPPLKSEELAKTTSGPWPCSERPVSKPGLVGRMILSFFISFGPA